MSQLKLFALDADDLKIISAHLQDAVGRAADMSYDKTGRRFVMVLNRFDWSAAQADAGVFQRRQAAIRFEKVDTVRSIGLDRTDKRAVVSLLAIEFEEKDAPSGTITLYFSGGPQVALDVECIEAELRDLSAAWTTQKRPEHPDGIGET